MNRENAVADYHKQLCSEMHELYKTKNAAYGNSFAKARKEVPYYTLGKLYDKFNRFMNLQKNPSSANHEPEEDTLLDMANYCLMELAERKADQMGLGGDGV